MPICLSLPLSLSLPLPRIGRVFTPKAVVSLKKEFEVDGGRAAQPRSDPTVKPGPGSSCGGNGGLLWRIAWCPLLQVRTMLSGSWASVLVSGRWRYLTDISLCREWQECAVTLANRSARWALPSCRGPCWLTSYRTLPALTGNHASYRFISPFAIECIQLLCCRCSFLCCPAFLR